MQIVWFKRDLRVEWHKPLQQALEKSSPNNPVVALALVEPEWFCSAEFHPRHLDFFLGALNDLRPQLEPLGVPLLVVHQNAVEAFQELHTQHSLTAIWAHEETGLDWTYKRDVLVQKWCKASGVVFTEHRQFCVFRGLHNRDLWAKRRQIWLQQRPLPCGAQKPPRHVSQARKNLELCDFGFQKIGWENPQPTRAAALQTLESFLTHRSESYLKSISSPLLSESGSSRISPYLAWGLLSIQEVIRRLNEAIDNPSLSPFERRNLQAFGSRLWWHCHFIQKLESEPRIEFHPFNSEFEGMRENAWRQDLFEAWCDGMTGIPLVDACMRSLKRTGWLNFRMRAMLVSVASFPLWLHWKKPAEHLARCFTDFEPGIHYPQVQMQAGVTGINTIRIYSPTKQAIEHDPNGVFIKRECPELSHLQAPDLFEPWNEAPLFASLNNSMTMKYPSPVVPLKESIQRAKKQVYAWKARPEVRKASLEVLKKHGSRKSKRPRSKAQEI